MSASLSLVPNKRALSVWIASFGVASLAFLILHQAPLIDKDIFERLMIAFGSAQQITGTPPQAINWLSVGGVLNAVGIVAFATGQTFLAARLPLLPRAFSSMSLFVLSLLYQFLLWQFLHIEAHTLGFAAAVAGGFAAGLFLRREENVRSEIEKHKFALKLRNKDLREIRVDLIKQNEIERRVLAADLHDQVLNDLKQVAQRFEKYSTEPDETNAQAIKSLTNQIMVEIREVMETLSPSVLEHLGMGAAVEDCLRRGSERSGFKVRFKNRLASSDLDCLSMVEQVLLYRLSQETVTNICKHAEASLVRATLEKEDNNLVIRISDDGKGMDPAKARGDSRGMKYQRYRAELVGAIIGWKPGENGKGTTVEITVDLSDRIASDREEEELTEDPKGTE
jgi:signal transduction histidine kinase